MLKKEQIHEALIQKIVDNYFLDNDYPLEYIAGKTIPQLYSKFNNEGDIDLCLKMLPYLQFERDRTFVIELFKYKNKQDFKEILYDTIINNTDILQNYSYEKYVLYRKAKDLLSFDKLEILEKTVFKGLREPQTKENNIDTISFDFDKVSLLNKMNEDIIFSTGQSIANEFVNFIGKNWEINRELQISLILQHQTNNPNIVKLVFVEPKDKQFIRKFVETIPDILGELLPLLSDKTSNFFDNQQDNILKHISAIKLDYSLPPKNYTKNKKI